MLLIATTPPHGRTQGRRPQRAEWLEESAAYVAAQALVADGGIAR
ncbi:hypothetical protein ACFU9B_40600 [Streptomyces sp. NPDC057592]